MRTGNINITLLPPEVAHQLNSLELAIVEKKAMLERVEELAREDLISWTESGKLNHCSPNINFILENKRDALMAAKTGAIQKSIKRLEDWKDDAIEAAINCSCF